MPIWLIMVPIGVLVFDIPLVENVGVWEMVKAYLRDFLALSGNRAYNPSWWFNTLILEFYLLFPFLYNGVKHAPFSIVVFVLLLNRLSFHHFNVEMNIYMLIFTVGIFMAVYNAQIEKFVQRVPMYAQYAVCFLLILVPCIGVPFVDHGMVHYTGIHFYASLTLGLVLLIKLLISRLPRTYRSIAFLGRHSANIYFIHTLIFCYWFVDFFYSIPSPTLMFGLLLVVCLAISIGLEWLKEKSRYNQLVKTITNYFD